MAGGEIQKRSYGRALYVEVAAATARLPRLGAVAAQKLIQLRSPPLGFARCTDTVSVLHDCGLTQRRKDRKGQRFLAFLAALHENRELLSLLRLVMISHHDTACGGKVQGADGVCPANLALAGRPTEEEAGWMMSSRPPLLEPVSHLFGRAGVESIGVAVCAIRANCVVPDDAIQIRSR